MARLCSRDLPSWRPTRRACFTVCTTRSAAPLVDEWYGEDRMWFTPFSTKNCSNYSEMNWGTLSLTRYFGSPKRANMSLRAVMVLELVVLLIMHIYGHFECESTTTSSIFPSPVQHSLHGCAPMEPTAMASRAAVLWVADAFLLDKTNSS